MRTFFSQVSNQGPDGFYHLVPIARTKNCLLRHNGEEYRVTQVVTAEDIKALHADLERRASSTMWPGLLGDREHWSYREDKTSEALAWFKEFEVRQDGLYGKPEKTEEGEQILGKSLRGLSPVLDVEPVGGVLVNNCEVRPKALDSVGFTNRPRYAGILRPVLNRAGEQEDETTNNGGNDMLLLNKALGLPDNAEEASAVEAVKQLMHRADSAEADLAEAKTRIENMEKEQLEAEADEFVEENRGRIENTDEAREAVKSQFVKDPDGTKAMFKSLADLGDKPPKVLHRADGQTPPEDPGEAERDAQRDAFVEKVRIQNRLESASEAWSLAATLKPELFTHR